LSESDGGARREHLSADAGRDPDAAVPNLSAEPSQGAAPGRPGTSEGNAASGSEVILAEPDLGLLTKLKGKNLAAQGLMVLEGRIAIERALDAGIVPRFLVCTEAEEEYWRHRPGRAVPRPGSGLDGKVASAPDAAAPREDAASQVAVPSVFPPAFPVRVMSHEALCALVEFKFHRGAIAVSDMPRIVPFKNAAAYAALREVFLCLWDVTDPSNLGALLRTAAGLGVVGVLLGPGCANPYYRKTVRVSMGNVFSIPLWSVNLGALESLNRNGARLVAAALTEKALTIEELGLHLRGRSGPLILILGNEGYGLPTEVLDLCTDEVRIPMARGVDSLNVAVAGGILMYALLSLPYLPSRE
jgi:tRNA G18 (ribose-2'-O)-methylase SpoU